MRAKIEKEIELLEQQREDFFGFIEKYSPDQLRFQSSPDTWSMLDVIEHLILAEEILWRQFRSKKDSQRKRGLKDRLKTALVFTVLKLNIKVKVPVATVMPKEKNLSLGELKQRWDEIRNQIKHDLKQLDDARLEFCYFIHPIAGHLDMLRGLRFVRIHIQHHWPQLKRIAKAL